MDRTMFVDKVREKIFNESYTGSNEAVFVSVLNFFLKDSSLTILKDSDFTAEMTSIEKYLDKLVDLNKELNEEKKDEEDYNPDTLFDEIYDEIEVSFDGNMVKAISNDTGEYCEIDNGDYIFFENDDVAEEEAIERVKEDLENDPDMFSKDWLMGHIEPMDPDTIASEQADSDIDGIDDKEILELADMEEEYDEMIEKEDLEGAEEVVEKAKEKYRDERYEDILEQVENNPIEYFEEFGYSVETMFKNGLIRIDIDDASEDAVNLDGAGHFLDSYDSNLEELDNGVVIANNESETTFE